MNGFEYQVYMYILKSHENVNIVTPTHELVEWYCSRCVDDQFCLQHVGHCKLYIDYNFYRTIKLKTFYWEINYWMIKIDDVVNSRVCQTLSSPDCWIMRRSSIIGNPLRTKYLTDLENVLFEFITFCLIWSCNSQISKDIRKRFKLL